MDAKQALGARLRKARKDAGLEQTDVANRLGVHAVTVSKWETGKQAIKAGIAQQMAELYGVPLSRLMGEPLSENVSRDTEEAWEPNPALAHVLPPRVYEAAMAYCRRLAAAGLPKDEVEEAERLFIDENYAKVNKRARRVLNEDELLELVDQTWRIMSRALSWRGLRA